MRVFLWWARPLTPDEVEEKEEEERHILSWAASGSQPDEEEEEEEEEEEGEILSWEPNFRTMMYSDEMGDCTGPGWSSCRLWKGVRSDMRKINAARRRRLRIRTRFRR